jgi:hypothetical protein
MSALSGVAAISLGTMVSPALIMGTHVHAPNLFGNGSVAATGVHTQTSLASIVQVGKAPGPGQTGAVATVPGRASTSPTGATTTAPTANSVGATAGSVAGPLSAASQVAGIANNVVRTTAVPSLPPASPPISTTLLAPAGPATTTMVPVAVPPVSVRVAPPVVPADITGDPHEPLG